MWNDSKMMRFWNIIYPVAMYFVVSNIATILLNMVWKQTNQNYLVHHMIATIVSFPVVYSYYVRSDAKKKNSAAVHVLILLAGMSLALALNRLLAFTPLLDNSAAYQEISSALYGSTLLLELLVTGVLTPILEETLYRGVVYTRLRDWIGVRGGILCSAVIFGLMHFNLVQFIYAGLIGILLAYVMEQFGLVAAIICHAAANIICVLHSELAVIQKWSAYRSFLLGEMLVMMVVAIISIMMLVRRKKK